MKAQRFFGLVSGAVGLLVFFLLLPRACQQTAVTPLPLPPSTTPTATVSPTSTPTAAPPTATVRPTSTANSTPVPPSATAVAPPTLTAAPPTITPLPPTETAVPDIGRHIVQRGDTYWQQATVWYGNPYCWPTLQARNAWDRFFLPVGGLMVIPEGCHE